MKKMVAVLAVLLWAQSTQAQPDTEVGLAANPDPLKNARDDAPPFPPLTNVQRDQAQKQNNPSGKLDLSTPENTVRSFVWAKNNLDMEAARSCVQNPVALGDGNIEGLQRDWKRGAPYGVQVISDLHSYQALESGRATVTLQLGLVTNAPLPPEFATRERLHLQRENGKWLIAPNDDFTPREFRMRFGEYYEDSLLMDVGWLCDQKAQRQKVLTERCRARMLEVNWILLSYANFHENKFDLPADWQEEIERNVNFEGGADTFVCPESKRGEESFSFNRELQNSVLNEGALTTNEQQDKVISIYEGQNENFVFRHRADGEAVTNVGFLTGRVMAYTAKQLEELIKLGIVKWKP